MGAKAWTEDEIKYVRDWYASGKMIKDCKIPGKSSDAIKSYAHSHGIENPKYRAWTEEEDAKLSKIWETDETIKHGMHILPGRTYNAARVRARLLKLDAKKSARIGSKSVILSLAISTMKKRGPMTVDEIANIAGINRSSLRQVFKKVRGIDVHVSGWKKVDANHQSMIFAVGPGQDAPKPAPKTCNQSWKEYKRKKAIERGKYNPFSIAAGLINVPDAPQGRVYKQDMTIYSNNLEDAA
ncbi:hypothetical protein [Burkholderia gladioli]|nr:hypothetical protein [Burkholderia gladioli]